MDQDGYDSHALEILWAVPARAVGGIVERERSRAARSIAHHEFAFESSLRKLSACALRIRADNRIPIPAATTLNAGVVLFSLRGSDDGEKSAGGDSMSRRDFSASSVSMDLTDVPSGEDGSRHIPPAI
jgi:hypothetical protein